MVLTPLVVREQVRIHIAKKENIAKNFYGITGLKASCDSCLPSSCKSEWEVLVYIFDFEHGSSTWMQVRANSKSMISECDVCVYIYIYIYDDNVRLAKIW